MDRGWMDGRVDGWMDEWLGELVDKWLGGWTPDQHGARCRDQLSPWMQSQASEQGQEGLRGRRVVAAISTTQR